MMRARARVVPWYVLRYVLGHAVRCVSLALAAVFLCSGLAGAQSAAPQAMGASPVGTWRGTSQCLVRLSPCNDEIVVYRSTAEHSADSVKLDARKLVRGVEEEMGALACHISAQNGALSCSIPRGTWHFRVRGDSLVGELLLADHSKFREVRTVRAPHD